MIEWTDPQIYIWAVLVGVTIYNIIRTTWVISYHKGWNDGWDDGFEDGQTYERIRPFDGAEARGSSPE